MDQDPETLNEETRSIWEENAAGWDAKMADGNRYFRDLIWPATRDLLSLRTGDRVLDVACGNGVTARAMASLGAQVTAFDFAPSMVLSARSREATGIVYSVADATSESDLRALGEGAFEAVHCGMAIFDIAQVDVLFRCVPRLLRPDGRFVFSLMHPCFNNPSIRFVGERDGDGGGERYAVQVSRYMTPHSEQGQSMRGLKPHFYFHRSFTDVLGAGFRNGMFLTGFEERAFPSGDEARSNPLGWGPTFSEIPAVVVIRMEAAANR